MLFGDKLAMVLDEKDLSQKEFAAMLNIAPTTINGYIKNKRQPDLELLRQMAFILGCTTDCLLDIKPEKNLSPRENALIGFFRRLSPDEQDIIFEVAKLSVNKKTQQGSQTENIL